ncbi:MAG: hypothetical protein JWL63_1548 [Rhodocyclales bacterium]|nr:hypothetical protein [Rhodocyclales bacterium]
MTKIVIRFVFGFWILVYPYFAFCGDPGPQKIVWVNLDGPPIQAIDDIIRTIILGDKPMCWVAGNKDFFMTRRPAEITTELVRAAFVSKNRKELKRLNELLQENLHRKVSEFDGVMAYTSNDQPTLIGYTRGASHPEYAKIKNPSDVKSVEEAFCLVLPDVVRKP